MEHTRHFLAYRSILLSHIVGAVARVSGTTLALNKQTDFPELHNTDVSELAIAIVAEIGTVAVCFTWLGIDSLGCVLWSLGGSLVPPVLQIPV